MDVLPGFLVAGALLAGSPGPATLSLAASGAAFGTRRSWSYFAGLVAGMAVVVALVASGLVGLTLALPGVGPAVTALAGLYLVWLAWRIATAPPLAGDGARGDPPGMAAGLLLSLVNPKGYAAMAALQSGFVLVPRDALLDAGAKLALIVLVIALVNMVWLRAGTLLARAFRDPRLNRAINIVFALALVASVAVALLV